MTGRVTRRRGRSVLTWLAVLAVVSLSSAQAASRYDPRLRFRSIATARFDIHFHQGEEAQARRLAVVAEEVAATLDKTLGPASGRVQIVLVNQSDLANGWATPVPYNLVEIAAAGPGGDSLLGNTDDWLRLVFTHEYTHIVHLGRTSGWIGGLQRAFGRNPALFPNLSLPLWAIEGIATFEESTTTARGRVNAGDFRQIVARAAGASRFEPIDRAGGGLDDWPAGNAPYAYGGLFHRFLAETYGQEALRRLTDETGRRLPYLGFTAYRRVFGRSLGQLWSDFASGMREPAPLPQVATRLTHHGFTVSGPRFAPDGRIYYSTVNAEAFPALMAIDPRSGQARRIAERYLGRRVAVSTELTLFDQMEMAANVGLQSDLYALVPGSSQPLRLSQGLRAGDPDVSPDGRMVAFTTQGGGRRDLSLAALHASPRPALGVSTALISAPDTEFGSPRWSPDGRWLAVERHVRGALPAIAIVEAATGSVRVVAASPTSRCVSPAWMPDGRRVLFAANPGTDPFQLFAVDVLTGVIERLEGAGASAHSPDVSSDGRLLVFVGYTPDGDDLFTMPLDSARWSPTTWQTVPDAPPSVTAADDSVARDYTPWATIAPRFWTPTIGSDGGEVYAGAAVASADALGRHGYFAGLQWTTSRARPDWQVSYAYDRWRPTLFLSAAGDTDPFRAGTARSTEFNLGAVVPWRRVRWTQSILGAYHASTDTVQCPGCDPAIDAHATRRAIRTGYSFTSARTYGYSISRESGWAASTTHEWQLRDLGSEGDAASIVADVRRYQPAWPRHGILAMRAATAHSWGDERMRRGFSESGSGPQAGGFVVDADAIGLLRGFDEDRRDWHALVANVDYRVPLVRIERGIGTLPIFVRSVHGAIFVDGGAAWNEAFRADDGRVSFGLELSADTVLGHTLPITFTAGAAWRRDGLDRQRGAAVFGRIGHAF